MVNRYPKCDMITLAEQLEQCEQMDGWCDAQKRHILAELVLKSKPDVVVETGVFGGRSIIPMALACKHNHKGIVWGIDPWSNEAALEGDHAEADKEWWSKINLEDVYRKFVQWVLRLEVTKECRWLRMRSVFAERFFDPYSVDIFHQDSNHSELVSCTEVELWENRIKPGGYWIIDDLDWETNKKAVEMVRNLSSSCEFDNGKWAIFRKR